MRKGTMTMMAARASRADLDLASGRIGVAAPRILHATYSLTLAAFLRIRCGHWVCHHVLSGEVLPKRQRIDVRRQAQSRRRIIGTFMLQRCDVLLQP
jgi:hypothetical protein